MTGVKKRGKGSESFHDESVDLSAGFIPKNMPAGVGPAAELTPDAFMAQHGHDVDSSNAEPEKFDFVPEAPVAPDGSEAKPIDGKAGLTWRWAAETDMPSLQILHFQAEIAGTFPCRPA